MDAPPEPGPPAGGGSAAAGTSRTGTEHHAERLWPSPGVWVVGVLLALTAGAAFYPAGGWPGVAAAGAVAVSGVVALLAWWSPRVRVVDVLRPGPDGAGGTVERWLQAGGARIPVSATGAATALDAAGWREALGPGCDARSYRLVRGWVAGGVRVDVADPRDSTPYWLVSSRRAQHLVAALRPA